MLYFKISKATSIELTTNWAYWFKTLQILFKFKAYFRDLLTNFNQFQIYLKCIYLKYVAYLQAVKVVGWLVYLSQKLYKTSYNLKPLSNN